MHKTIATGNVGKDAVIKNLANTTVINFNVAVNKKTKNAQGVDVETTQWYDCSLFRQPNQSTEIAQYLKKGTKVLVEGEPTLRLYQDKDGRTAAALDLRVNNVELLSPKKEDAAPVAQPAASEPAATGSTAAAAKAGLGQLPESNFENE